MLLERPRLRILFLLSILRKDHENFRLYIARNATNHIMREMFGGCGLPTGTVLGISELVTEISQLSLAKRYLIAQRLYCEVNGRWKRHTRKRRVVEVGGYLGSLFGLGDVHVIGHVTVHGHLVDIFSAIEPL
jgi:hypothetical protein